jgi:hypothetical protein
MYFCRAELVEDDLLASAARRFKKSRVRLSSATADLRHRMPRVWIGISARLA